MDCFVFVSVSLYVYDDVCTCVRLYVCVCVCVFIYIIGECVLYCCVACVKSGKKCPLPALAPMHLGLGSQATNRDLFVYQKRPTNRSLGG